ncbi:MAG: hypothetical protein PQJ47_02300 [Sphaerochaetaceae bacterium]|nr:hypothetical protein [Sphaerochaetaceae bacterium]MDC7247965.1 hypothetical protein [Sphaerochaetaceae bacterium]
MRTLGIITVFLLVLLAGSCVESHEVTLYLSDDHNWELESGRRMWYTLLYSCENEVHSIHLSVGTRKVTLLLPLLDTHIFAAYPLGYLPPAGTALTPLSDDRIGYLTYEKGPMCDVLIRFVSGWGAVVSNINVDRILQDIAESEASLLSADYYEIAARLIRGEYESNDIVLKPLFSTTLDTFPAGKYLSSSPLIPSFYKNSSKEVTIPSLPPGTHHFFNYGEGLVAVFSVPESDEYPISYYMKTPDSLFTISDKEYQLLLEH